MKENKSNKGLIIALIIIIAVLFMSLIVISVKYTLLKYTCRISNNFTKGAEETFDYLEKNQDKINKYAEKFVNIITKQLDDGTKIPYVDYDSEDAEDINDDIEDFYDDMNISKDSSVVFKVFDNDNVESIVIRYNPGGVNYTYKVYNINKKTGKRVTATDLMKVKGFTLDQIKTKMKTVWMEKVKTSEGYSMPTNSNKNISVENATKANITKLTTDDIILYLNKEGHLCVIYEEYQIAGAETGLYIIDLDKSLYTELK